MFRFLLDLRAPSVYVRQPRTTAGALLLEANLAVPKVHTPIVEECQRKSVCQWAANNKTKSIITCATVRSSRGWQPLLFCCHHKRAPYSVHHEHSGAGSAHPPLRSEDFKGGQATTCPLCERGEHVAGLLRRGGFRWVVERPDGRGWGEANRFVSAPRMACDSRPGVIPRPWGRTAYHSLMAGPLIRLLIETIITVPGG